MGMGQEQEIDSCCGTTCDKEVVKGGIDELKNRLNAIVYLIDGAYCENSEGNLGLEREWLNHLYRMIGTDNDNQCIDDIKADEIDRLRNEILVASYNAELDQDDIINYLENESKTLREGL